MSFKDKRIIAIWKPRGPSSFRVVSAIRKATGERKIGHAGTLDPMAEGVLVVAIGREGTRELHHIVNTEKEYETKICLGIESSTDDEEGIKTIHEIKTAPSKDSVQKTVRNYEGNIEQVPPVYSAIKIKGKPAYKLARRGKELSLSPRSVVVKKIEIMNYAWPTLELRITTGPGVYIRSIARDIGKDLKTGGYITDLVRTRVGSFTKESCEKTDGLDFSYHSKK